MKRILLFLITTVFVLFSISSYAQKGKNRRYYQANIIYSNGTNHFMGDLGGGKYEAAHFLGVRDLDYQVTRPTWQIGYRFRFHKLFAYRITYTYALITGKDKASGYVPRQARNLMFRSPIMELGGQIEYYFIEEKPPARFSHGSLVKRNNLAAYLFLGGGGLYFNPKGYYEPTGKWIPLQPLGTEGQYANPDGTPFQYTYYYQGKEEILETPKPYSRIAAYLSIGLGLKYSINKRWAVGLEISNRYTSSDYIDDAHDRYFNYSEFGLTPPSEYTEYFADRHLPYHYEEDGTMVIDGDEPADIKYPSGKPGRGNPNYNDAYIFTLITVYYRLPRSRSDRYKF